MLNTLDSLKQEKQLAINLKQKHAGHPKEIVKLPNAGTGPGRHYGRIQCRLCKTFVAWATKEQVKNNKEIF